MGPEFLVLVVVFLVLLLVVMTGRSGRDDSSTAGHYDPNAIGQYTLDPATMQYRLELPSMPRTGSAGAPEGEPPHPRRRRRQRPPSDGQGA